MFRTFRAWLRGFLARRGVPAQVIRPYPGDVALLQPEEGIYHCRKEGGWVVTPRRPGWVALGYPCHWGCTGSTPE